MKKIMLLLVGIACAWPSEGQTFDEWFSQKKTQTKYLLEQIAALQIYLGDVQKGYALTRDGWRVISDIRQGDLDLHKDYFQALKKVNPAIQKYPRVEDILRVQHKIDQIINRHRKAWPETGQFSAAELNHLDAVYARLSADGVRILDDLAAATGSGELNMKDGERIRRIDRLYTATVSQYHFVSSFGKETWILAAERAQEQSNIHHSRVLYGIHNERP